MLMMLMWYLFSFRSGSYSAHNIVFIYIALIYLSINIVQVMNAEGLVQCTRNNCSPQIQQQALVVMTTITSLYPVDCCSHYKSNNGEIK